MIFQHPQIAQLVERGTVVFISYPQVGSSILPLWNFFIFYSVIFKILMKLLIVVLLVVSTLAMKKRVLILSDNPAIAVSHSMLFNELQSLLCDDLLCRYWFSVDL